MLKNLSADHIYIVCGHTDMRKSIDGLAAIIQQQYQLDLFSNSAFLFCGRRRNRMKVLLWLSPALQAAGKRQILLASQ